jgi:hypothetical protein
MRVCCEYTYDALLDAHTCERITAIHKANNERAEAVRRAVLASMDCEADTHPEGLCFCPVCREDRGV